MDEPTHAITLNPASALLLAAGIVRMHGLPYRPPGLFRHYYIHASPTIGPAVIDALNGDWGAYMLQVPGIESLDDIKAWAGSMVGTAFLDAQDVYYGQNQRGQKVRMGWMWKFNNCRLGLTYGWQPVPYAGVWTYDNYWKVKNDDQEK